jgi:hypothetical protein
MLKHKKIDIKYFEFVFPTEKKTRNKQTTFREVIANKNRE